MQIKSHQNNTLKSAEIVSNDLIISTIEEGANLMADLYYQGYDRIIIYEHNIIPEFFDLKSKMAGEILQKFSNFRMKLAIVGDFSSHNSKSFTDFKYESNNTKDLHFALSLDEVLKA